MKSIKERSADFKVIKKTVTVRKRTPESQLPSFNSVGWLRASTNETHIRTPTHTLVCKLRLRQTETRCHKHSRANFFVICTAAVVHYRHRCATGVGCSVWLASEIQSLVMTALCQQFLETGSLLIQIFFFLSCVQSILLIAVLLVSRHRSGYVVLKYIYIFFYCYKGRCLLRKLWEKHAAYESAFYIGNSGLGYIRQYGWYVRGTGYCVSNSVTCTFLGVHTGCEMAKTRFRAAPTKDFPNFSN